MCIVFKFSFERVSFNKFFSPMWSFGTKNFNRSTN